MIGKELVTEPCGDHDASDNHSQAGGVVSVHDEALVCVEQTVEEIVASVGQLKNCANLKARGKLGM
jgi:hypothetical protein